MEMAEPGVQMTPVSFETHPSQYRHWRVSYDGPVATLTLDVNEDAGIRPGYRLKLNSYDLGVDIELADAIQRIRFEHPEVGVVVVTGAKPKVFSAGANIYMLARSSHAWKVNFCKFTNETRNGMEDSSAHSGLKFLAALNGIAAGGGYELALACDEIVLIDDRNSAVSLPEVSLLGVLPGTGGLTRLIDKRRVRRDLADVFCTSPDGVRGQRAVEWGLVDAAVRSQEFPASVQRRAGELAAAQSRPAAGQGIALIPLSRRVDDAGVHYQYVDVQVDRGRRLATVTVTAPDAATGRDGHEALREGAAWWPLQMARELDDAILHLRTNELELGLWLLETRGRAQTVLDYDRVLLDDLQHWFIREVVGLLRRTLARLDVSSRSMFAIVTPESCCAGTLAELAFAADRTYMLQTEADPSAMITVSGMNLGALPMPTGEARLAARVRSMSAVDRMPLGAPIRAIEAAELGLVTAAPDELDWEDELRQAIESRIALSPDALTGMEASLRFPLPETQASRVFGRLSAWQNWIFTRPNAAGPDGALTVYGTGVPTKFDWTRV